MAISASLMRYFRSILQVVLLALVFIPCDASTVQAKVALSNSEANLRIYGYRILLEGTQEREKIGLVSADLRKRAENAEAAWNTARNELENERAQGATRNLRIRELEQDAVESKLEFARTIDELTNRLAEQDREFRAKLRQAIADGNRYLETEAGRKALDLFAQGGIENIAQGLELLDAELVVQDQIAAFERAERYRQHARTRSGVRGIGSATTNRIIELYETVVAYDPQAGSDWLELARLYRDARRIKDAVNASDNAVRFAEVDQARGVALFERAEIEFVRWVDEDAFKPAEELIRLLDNTPAELESWFNQMTPEERQGFLLFFVDSILAMSAPEGDLRKVQTYFLQSKQAIAGSKSGDDLQRDLFIGKASLRMAEVEYFITRSVMAEFVLIELRSELKRSGDRLMTDDQLMKETMVTLIQKAASLKSQFDLMGEQLDGGWQAIGPSLSSDDPVVALNGLDAAIQTLKIVTELKTPDDKQIERYQAIYEAVQFLLVDYPDLVLAQQLVADIQLVMARGLAKSKRLEEAEVLFANAFATYDALIERDPGSVKLRVGRLLAWVHARAFVLETPGWREIAEEYNAMKGEKLLAPDDQARFMFGQMTAIASGGLTKRLVDAFRKTKPEETEAQASEPM